MAYVWVYLVGACFIAAALSLVTGIRARLAASLLALTFFLFVVLMDAPGWAHHPRNRFALTFVLRELSFSGGPLALAATLSERRREGGLAHRCYDCALLCCDSRPIFQLRAVPARRSRSRHTARTIDSRVDLFFIELVVYVPIGVVERASLDNGLNYVADTLMFCGAVLLLAGAMPRSLRSA